jgi:hypothetical protein
MQRIELVKTRLSTALQTQLTVVLGDTLTPARSTGLDLSGPQSDRHVGNVGGASLTRSVRLHDTPRSALGELNTVQMETREFSILVNSLRRSRHHLRLDGLADGSDLVDLQQQTVASLLLDGGLDPLGVGDGQVVTDNLDLGVLGHVGPSLPVVLVEGVLMNNTVSTLLCLDQMRRIIQTYLDGDDGVLLDEASVKLSELNTGQPLGLVRVGVLEAEGTNQDQYCAGTDALPSSNLLQVVLSVLVELGRSDVKGDRDLTLVTGGLDSLHQELEGLLGTRDVGSETTLITDVGS